MIAAPLSVVPVWEREFKDYADFKVEVKVLTGSIKKRIEALQQWKDPDALQVIVINYEGAWRKGMFEELVKWQPDLMIADESQRIKNHGTKQSKALHKLGDRTRCKMILTGTPVTAGPLDFFSQYRFLDPNVFGKAYYPFRNRYAVMGGFEGKQVIGYKNKEELVRKAHSIAHRVTKEEALDLPDQIDQDLYCTLEPKAEKSYREMLNINVAQLETERKDKGQITASNALSCLLRLQQIVGGFVPKDGAEQGDYLQVSTAKLTLLKETLNDLIGAGHKVVVFARFRPEIEAIMAMLDSESFNGVGRVRYSHIYGSVPQNQRGEMVHEFQTDPEVRVFIAQVQTAGLGITLHAADTAIFYSADFSYANYDQCRARIHRIGQQNKVNYLHLIAKDTVDEKIYKAIKTKKSIADDVVDNWQSYFD